MSEPEVRCDCLDRLQAMRSGETPCEDVVQAVGETLECTVRSGCAARHVCSERATCLLTYCFDRLNDPRA